MNKALPPFPPLSWVASLLRQARRNMGTAMGCLPPPPSQCLPPVSWDNCPASLMADQQTTAMVSSSVQHLPLPRNEKFCSVAIAVAVALAALQTAD